MKKSAAQNIKERPPSTLVSPGSDNEKQVLHSQYQQDCDKLNEALIKSKVVFQWHFLIDLHIISADHSKHLNK